MQNKYSESESIRLDKWLWAARFFKTRALASEAISRGKVLVNGIHAKSSRRIRVNDQLQIKKGPYEWLVSVEKLSEIRGPARDAIELYCESGSSLEARKNLSRLIQFDRLSRPVANGRPDKKERRRLLFLKKTSSK
jgi:ribosome-associated heat shock protein Hsp15